jgi:hypothetical protein
MYSTLVAFVRGGLGFLPPPLYPRPVLANSCVWQQCDERVLFEHKRPIADLRAICLQTDVKTIP